VLSEAKPSRTPDLPHLVKAILASKGLTLRQVSQRVATVYGKSSPFFLPHNFYYDLGLRTFTPSLYQLFALSRISNYKLDDWLRVFGFDLGNLNRLKILLPSHRTVLLDPSLDDARAWILWFESKPGKVPRPGIVPMGRLLDYSSPRQLASLSEINNRTFLYAKLGRHDAFAFPDLLPGSIVRVNPRWRLESFSSTNEEISDHFFLIAHSRGLSCCRLHRRGRSAVVPISTQLPYAQVELRVPEEVSILGVVDAEIRPLLRLESPEVSQQLATHWQPEMLATTEIKLGALLRDARKKAGLSFRGASAMSRQIADFLRDEHYFASPGCLSDYETLDMPPRHIHKAITLCAVYGLHWSMFLRSVGLQLENAGAESIGDRLLDRGVPARLRVTEGASQPEGKFLGDLLKQWDSEIPLFLRGSVGILSGLSNFSLHDVFWIGQHQSPLPTARNNGILAIVNRRKKTPLHWKSKPLWQQPAYMLLKRDGRYLCEFCSLEDGALLLHSYTQGYHHSERLRNRQDAEVIGQVVTFARKLL